MICLIDIELNEDTWLNTEGWSNLHQLVLPPTRLAVLSTCRTSHVYLKLVYLSFLHIFASKNLGRFKIMNSKIQKFEFEKFKFWIRKFRSLNSKTLLSILYLNIL